MILSSHWEFTTRRTNSNQHLQQLQDTPHYDNPPPINSLSRATTSWISEILLKNNCSAIIKLSFIILINKFMLCSSNIDTIFITIIKLFISWSRNSIFLQLYLNKKDTTPKNSHRNNWRRAPLY